MAAWSSVLNRVVEVARMILGDSVDAVNATAQLDTHAEAVKQIAVADRIILTKTDLAEAAAVRVLRARITGLNRSAPVLDTGETLVVGDAILLPTRIRIAPPRNEPLSGTIDFWDRWAADKAGSDLPNAIEGWRRQTVLR